MRAENQRQEESFRVANRFHVAILPLLQLTIPICLLLQPLLFFFLLKDFFNSFGHRCTYMPPSILCHIKSAYASHGFSFHMALQQMESDFLSQFCIWEREDHLLCFYPIPNWTKLWYFGEVLLEPIFSRNLSL